MKPVQFNLKLNPEALVEQAEENLTRRYRRVESLERIAQIRRLREQKKTIPEIKEILGCGEL